jgi:large-conductance mechanosensitive channel
MAGKWIETNNLKRIAFSILIYSFIGAMIQHLVGSILYEVELNQFFVLLGQPPGIATAAYPGIWAAVFLTYPLERIFLVVSAVLIGTPILIAIIRNRFLRLGNPQLKSAEQPKTESKGKENND